MLDAMKTSRRFRAFLSMSAATLLAVTAVGCGDDNAKPASGDDKAQVAGSSESVSDTSTETESGSGDESDLPTDGDIEKYFEAFAEREPGALNDALGLTEPGSVAEAFLLYTISVVDAVIAAGYNSEELASDLREIDGGWRVCDDASSDEDGDDCKDYTDIEGRGGKIVNFLADGNQLNDRIARGTGEPVAVGDLGTVTLRAAYQALDPKQTIVVLDITSAESPIQIPKYNAKYRSAEGRQYTAGDDSFGGDELNPESTTTVALVFLSAEFGGELTVELQDEDYNEETATLPIG